MNINLSISVLLIISILLGCSTAMMPGLRGKMGTKGISIEEDTFEETKNTTVNVPIQDWKTMTEFSLGFKEIKTKEGKTYLMHSYIYKKNWLFVKSIAIKIDGQKYEFKSIKDIRETLNGGYIEEYNTYRCSIDFIEKISKASKIDIRLYGSDYYLDEVIPSDKINDFSIFYKKVSSN